MTDVSYGWQDGMGKGNHVFSTTTLYSCFPCLERIKETKNKAGL